MALADGDFSNNELLRKLKEITPDLEVVTDASSLRPSMLLGVEAVIDLSPHTPQTLLRDLVVRGISVVMVGREPQTYSFNAVLVDVGLGASLLMRNLSLSGHRRFVCVESDGSNALSDAARATAQRFAEETTVELSKLNRLIGSVKSIEATAVLCDSVESAEAVRHKLEEAGLNVPRDVSVAAVGCGSAPFPASGYYVRYSQAAETIAELISRGAGKRPATIWLTGQFSDVHSVSAVRTHRMPAETAASTRDSLPA